MATREEQLNARYREKIRAREERRAPIVITGSEPVIGGPASDVDARYQAKLAARSTVAKPEPKAEEPKVEAKAEAKVEPKPEPKAEEPKRGDNNRR